MAQVYVIAAEDAYIHGAAVISATDVNFNITNDLLNKGTIQGDTAKISANNINNVNGIIQGSYIALNAVRNINNTGSSIISQNSFSLFAGEDISINSKLNTLYSSQGHTTNIGAIGTVKVTGESGTLNMQAGKDVNINAGIIDNAAGETNITAANNINLGTAEISRSQDIVWDSDNKRHDDMTAETGSVITDKGSINLNAGNSINARAAAVYGEEYVNLNAQNDINVEAGRQEINLTDDHKHKGSSGGGHSQTVTIHNEIHENTAIGSSLYGDNVNINAGKEFNLSGSDITAENAITVNSGADTNIIGAENAYDKTHTYKKDKKGFLSSEKTNSTVSGGTVDINSGRNVNIAASNVVADNDVNINAEGKIDAGTMEDTYESEYIYKVKKSASFPEAALVLLLAVKSSVTNMLTRMLKTSALPLGASMAA